VKSLLNNLIGRLGLNFVKPITEVVNKVKLDRILSTRVVNTFQKLNEDNFLMTYNPVRNKEICENHNLDYYKVVLGEGNKQLIPSQMFRDVSLVTALFVTSYAREYMQRVKILILNAGGLIYYSDTDSIVTNLNLKDLNEVLKDKVGNKLGQLKLEHLGEKAYFIFNKPYILITLNGQEIKKAKGISPDSLSQKDFEDMYLNSKSVQGLKTSSKTNYSKGSVTIETKNITIN
jgi:hypothetical protein